MNRYRNLPPLLCLALFFHSCGFGSEESFTGRRIGNGIAPYRDQGDLQMCSGNDRLGAPTSRVGGFCGGTPRQTACSDDGDCKSRERCVCGVCNIQFCSSATECGAGRVCSFSDGRCDRPCASRKECSTGESCINQVCRSTVCTADSQCQAGERCGTATPRRCVVDPCSVDADCRIPGARCQIQRRPRMLTEPTVLVDANAASPYTMWLSLDEPGSRVAIYRAVSADGIHYRLSPGDAAVIAPESADNGRVEAPSVIRSEISGGYEMLFSTGGGASISRATSVDGIVWQRDTAPGLVPTYAWEAGRLAAPALIAVGQARLVAYEVGDGDGIGLSIARAGDTRFERIANDGRLLTKQSVENSILWRDISKLRSPSLGVVPATGSDTLSTIRIWFSASGQESSATIKLGQAVETPANASIGVATFSLEERQLTAASVSSRNLVIFPWNPVFDRVIGFVDHPSELAPAVVEAPAGERYFLYYGRAKADGTQYENLGVAVNP